MTMKTFKISLLAAAVAVALSGPALARDDFGNCIGAIKSDVSTAAISQPGRDLFVLVDQTVRFDRTFRTLTRLLRGIF